MSDAALVKDWDSEEENAAGEGDVVNFTGKIVAKC